MKLSRVQKQHLAEDGFLAVPRVVPSKITDAALREINHRLGLGKQPDRDTYADTEDYLSLYASTPAIMQLLLRSPAWDLAESLLGADNITPVTQGQIALRFPSKDETGQRRENIHIDGLHSVNADRPIVRYTLCLGVFLSDTPREDMGNFTGYPGSHRLVAKRIREHGLMSLSKGIAKSIVLPPPRQVTGRSGDVVLFNFQTAHDKGPNRSPFIRYMVYFRLSHIKTESDRSLDYIRKTMLDPWLEWPGLKCVAGVRP